MKIKHNNKQRSDKLFNELVLFYLINKSGFFYEYEASSLLNVSNRTLRRYVDEISKTCILHRNGKKLTTYIKNGCKSYYAYLDVFCRKTKLAGDVLHTKSILLPIGFCQNHPKGLDSKNKHIVRLTKCALLLHQMVNILREVEFGHYELNEGMTKCIKYYLKNINANTSLEVIKEDMKLVINTIFFMKNR